MAPANTAKTSLHMTGAGNANLQVGKAVGSFSSGSNIALARQMNGEADKWEIYRPHYFPL